MKISAVLLAAASLAVGPASITCASPAWVASAYASCCKTCKKGRACGDSCISRDKECHKGKGCARDG